MAGSAVRAQRQAVWVPKHSKNDAEDQSEWFWCTSRSHNSDRSTGWNPKGQREAWIPKDWASDYGSDQIVRIPGTAPTRTAQHHGAYRHHKSEHMRRHIKCIERLLSASDEGERFDCLSDEQNVLRLFESPEYFEHGQHRTRWRNWPRVACGTQQASCNSPHVQLQLKRVGALYTKSGRCDRTLSSASTASSECGGTEGTPESIDSQDCCKTRSWSRQEVMAGQDLRQSLVGVVPASRAESAIIAVVLAGLPQSTQEQPMVDCMSRCAPTMEQRACVDRCLTELRAVIRKLSPSWRVLPFGSHVNGLALGGSDLDVTCISNGSDNAEERNDYSAVYALHSVFCPLLQRHPSFKVTEQVLKARVPILKLRFEQQLDVDFSWNNSKPLQNTRLIQAYVNLGTAVRDLIIAVKLWAHAADVCGASQSKLSTYSFTLMAIYFLQVDPEVQLPCLPTPTAEAVNFQQVDMFSEPEKFDTSWQCNLPLPVLLGRFFRFYAEQFAWGLEVVSVRRGERTDSGAQEYALLSYREKQRMHIEDPCEPKRNLHCVLGADEEFGLRQAFAEAVRVVWNIRLPFYFQSIQRTPPRPGIEVQRDGPSIDNRQSGGARASKAKSEGHLRRRWPAAKAYENFHQMDVSDFLPPYGNNASTDASNNSNDNACYWFALVGSCYLYTLYASFSGHLFRLFIAIASLCLVFIEQRRRGKPQTVSKSTQVNCTPVCDSSRRSRSRGVHVPRWSKDEAKRTTFAEAHELTR